MKSNRTSSAQAELEEHPRSTSQSPLPPLSSGLPAEEQRRHGEWPGVRPNFIKHFLAFMDKLATDHRLTPHHVSLYITLFQAWNLNHFRNPISVSRGEIMFISKIGSVNTYVKCLKELHTWNYIRYQPSFNPLRGSKIHLYRFDKAESKADDNTTTQPVRPSLNKSNTVNPVNSLNGTPPTMIDVTDFFLSENSGEQEAQKFFNHYQSNGWLLGGRTPMRDWRAAARKWILNISKFHPSQKPSTRHVSTNKNYNEPL